MIVEERMYTLHVGNVPEFMATYESEGLPLLRRYLQETRVMRPPAFFQPILRAMFNASKL